MHIFRTIETICVSASSTIASPHSRRLRKSIFVLRKESVLCSCSRAPKLGTISNAWQT